MGKSIKKLKADSEKKWFKTMFNNQVQFDNLPADCQNKLLKNEAYLKANTVFFVNLKTEAIIEIDSDKVKFFVKAVGMQKNDKVWKLID